MKKYVFFLLKWILIFLVGSILIFGVVRLMPTSPVDHYLTKMSLPLTEENRAVIRKNMGLDKPVVQQYFDWIFDFLRGNWGVSLTSHTDIRTEFLAKMPYSFGIGIGGILIGAVFAWLLGYRAAYRQSGFCDRFSAALSVVTQTIPGFILALLIIYFLGVKLKAVKFFTGDGNAEHPYGNSHYGVISDRTVGQSRA